MPTKAPAVDVIEDPCDSNGVDRSQIRELLALTPTERLEWLDAFVNDLAALQRLIERPSH
jgi:hypothetical protein